MSDPRPQPNQTNRYRALREFALGAAIVRSTPPSLQIARSNHCNFKCAYCSDHRVGNEIPRSQFVGETWQALLDLIPASTTMAFHGVSEFLIDPEFFAIVERCAAAGVTLSLNTNGSVCTPKYVDALVRYPATLLVNFSVDAASAATYRRIRGWHFDRLLRNVDTYVRAFAARTAPTRTTLSYVILASNMHETAAIVRLAARLGVDGVKFYRLHEYDSLDWRIPTAAGAEFDYRAECTSRLAAEHDAAIAAARAAARELGVEIELPAAYAAEETG